MKILNFFNVHLKRVQPACTLLQPRDEPDFEGRDDMWEPVEPGPDNRYPDGREPDLGPVNTEPAAESDMDENGR